MKKRVKYIDISAAVIAKILKMAAKDALPKDAEILQVYYEPLTYCFRLFVHSKKFPLLNEGEVVPKHGDPVILDDMLK